MSMKENINDVIARNAVQLMKEDSMNFDDALEAVNEDMSNLIFYKQTQEDRKMIEKTVNRFLKGV